VPDSDTFLFSDLHPWRPHSGTHGHADRYTNSVPHSQTVETSHIIANLSAQNAYPSPNLKHIPSHFPAQLPSHFPTHLLADALASNIRSHLRALSQPHLASFVQADADPDATPYQHPHLYCWATHARAIFWHCAKCASYPCSVTQAVPLAHLCGPDCTAQCGANDHPQRRAYHRR